MVQIDTLNRNEGIDICGQPTCKISDSVTSCFFNCCNFLIYFNREVVSVERNVEWLRDLSAVLNNVGFCFGKGIGDEIKRLHFTDGDLCVVLSDIMRVQVSKFGLISHAVLNFADAT